MDQQKTQDMLGALQAQRDQAMNTIVYLQAEIIALQRRIKELEERNES